MWFDATTGAIIGACAGSFIGITGGAWGALAGVNARKGRYRKIVIYLARFLIILGTVFLVTGIAALLTGQPRHVWYPFGLTGFILLTCLIPNYFSVKKIYINAELKKMAVNDLR
jgi:amino acid permease